MADKQIIQLPDIGGVVDAEVIEVFVRPGDQVSLDDTLIAIEGDKATMEVPSTHTGVVVDVMVSVGDKLQEGDSIVSLSINASIDAVNTVTAIESDRVIKVEEAVATVADNAFARDTIESGLVFKECIPDIGGSTDVEVIELAVAVGDYVNVDETLMTLESDKATMDVPSSHAGIIESLKIQVGDRVSAGDLIATINASTAKSINESKAPVDNVSVEAVPDCQLHSNRAESVDQLNTSAADQIYAGPAVRRMSRELNIDLTRISGTGQKGRITKEDLLTFVKSQMQGGHAGNIGLDFAAMPSVDFSQFGPVDTIELLKIQKLSGRFLHRNWVQIPHVTQFGESDITELEAFRQKQKKNAADQGVRLTALVFIMKAVVRSLKAFPRFNASLDQSGDYLVLKQYYHIGVAVDTPNGLVVPVIRDVDQKSLFELAQELSAISEKARTKGLSMQEMQGGCFTISSLGGIGGTAFTPIINAPEVAILGVSRSETKPVYDAGQWLPRLMLPLSLSYDHRVIDGALGARFMVHLSSGLSDIRTLLL